VKIFPRLLRPDKWIPLLTVLILLPFDLFVAIGLWFSDLFYLPAAALLKSPGHSGKPEAQCASLIILNWDGRHLLEQFLPSVIRAVKHDGRDHEVIVVDNGSLDESVKFLNDHYPQVKIVALPTNMRFTGGNNAGVQAASKDIVIFLNNDMEVDPDFIAPLLKRFEDDRVFAVSCQVFFQDKSRRREETGKTRAQWKLGFIDLYHDQINSSDCKENDIPIFWGGGGSCAFDRQKFLAMGGLDRLYDPFYLEDTDLSYQAWKRGWRSVLAADSIVVHKHRGTNKLKFGDNYVDNTIRKNQYLFVWKNITDFRWTLTHGFLLPLVQARFICQTHWGFELRAFFRAFVQLPEALLKRYRGRGAYILGDAEIFERACARVPGSGENDIDFSSGNFLEQLGPGWYERECHGREGFRWMSRNASLFLFPKGEERALEISGAVPDWRSRKGSLKLKIFCNKNLIYTKQWRNPERFRLRVPFKLPSGRACRFDFRLNATVCPARAGIGEDTRELGIVVSQIRLV